MKDSPNNETNFGFSKVAFDQKRNLVKDIFSNVAPKYDIMNDLMSFGIHRLWKEEFIRQIPNLNSKILDVAAGTGDISFRIIDRAKAYRCDPSITLCDINPEMLQIAKNRAIDRNILMGIDYICCDAEKLPFEDNSFDYYTIAFGIRNVSKIDDALAEAYRVLKPNGKFLCLEFSKLQNDCLRNLYNLYSFNIIPKLGKFVANNEDAYKYLVESINLFPDQDSFAVMIKDAGFKNVKYNNLTFGTTAIHTGYKIT